MRHAVICGVSSSTIFSHIISQTAQLKKVIEHKMCVLMFFYNFCLKHFSLDEELSEI